MLLRQRCYENLVKTLKQLINRLYTKYIPLILSGTPTLLPLHCNTQVELAAAQEGMTSLVLGATPLQHRDLLADSLSKQQFPWLAVLRLDPCKGSSLEISCTV